MNTCGAVELSKCIITSPAFYISASILGWIMLYSIAAIIETNQIGLILSYIGKHTLAILLLHGLSFKIISILLVLLDGMPYYMIASYPIIFEDGMLTKLLYTFIGVSFPLLLTYLYFKLKKSIMSIKDF